VEPCCHCWVRILSGEGAALIHRAVATACAVAAHASTLLLHAIITPRAAPWRDGTLLAHCTQWHDAPPWKQAGLPRCQPTCPVCQGQATPFDLGAPGPATALNADRWAGDPRRASCHTHVEGPAQLLSQGRHVAAPDPSPEGGGTGPSRPVGAVRPVMVRPSHAADPDLPGGSGSAGATRELPCLPCHAEAPDPRGPGEGPETTVPAVRPKPYATSPRRRRGDHGC
jgi:hypothetical protein